MSVIHAPKKPELDARMLVFPSIMFVLLLVLFFRLWYFQVVKAPELVEKAEASREIKVTKPAPRGLIYDRNGTLIAGVRPEIVVTAIPAVVNKNPWVLPEVAKLLGVDVKKLEGKVKDAMWRRYVPSPIYVGANIQAGTKIAEAGEDLPGIGVESQPMRFYPDTVSFTHILGYVWVPSGSDVERIKGFGRSPAEYVGKQGVERAYEADLMGEAGAERMEVDARRRPVRVVGRDNATPGRKLILSLDAGLQKFTTQLFASKGFKGGAVVIDPRNGEILSIVSSPTFDQKVFQGGISQVEWDALMNDERNPMINRAIGSAYAPGSTFKIVTALAAQQEGKFSPYGPIFCGGGYRLGRHLFKCLGRHGAISFEAAMAGSCNTYFSTLGRAVGREKLVEVAKSVGLGVRTGLEIGGESRGDLPTEGWLENRSNRKPAVWYGGDAVNTSLGQGAVNTTPIQMANLAALVANNGTSYVPHLVRAVKDPTGTKKPKPVEPVVAHKVDAPPEFWATMKRSLVRVISNGTARSAQISGVTWGGKTGSAEHRRGKKTHGWFVGFAPAENPKIAICVMVEAAGHGGDVAAPIARDIVNRYLTKAEAKKATSASAAAALSRAPAAR